MTGWADILDVGEALEPAPAPGQAAVGPAGERGLRRWRSSLGRTRKALAAELRASFGTAPGEIDWERLEEALIAADVGAPTTAEVVGRLEAEAEEGEFSSAEAARERLVELLAQIAGEPAPLALRERPAIVMVVGVNGTGKTTTVGKLAAALAREAGLRPLVAAADTYRAAAVEQLERWCERAGVEIVRGQQGGDPGAVVFDAIDAAANRGLDLVIADTAGRLHTREDLMGELAKVRRVIGKRVEGAPHETLLVIDATTGQNGLRQARMFADAADVTGIVLTKLDGSAKGGVALAITRELGIPVKLVGTGESVEDLSPFDPAAYAAALLADEAA